MELSLWADFVHLLFEIAFQVSQTGLEFAIQLPLVLNFLSLPPGYWNCLCFFFFNKKDNSFNKKDNYGPFLLKWVENILFPFYGSTCKT